MKKAAIILSVIALIAISCGEAKKKQTETIAENNIKESHTEISCDEKLKSLITTSSNFDNPFKDKLSVRIDSKENDIYSIELFVKDSGENSENTVGTIQLNLNNNTLVDITDDVENGTPLKYNKELFDSYVSGCLGKNLAQSSQITNFDINQ